VLSKAFGVGAVYWNLRRFCTKPSLMYRSYKPKRLVSKKIMKRWTIAKECRLKQLQKQLTAAKLSTLLCLFYFTFFCILVSWYPINQLINRLLRIRQHDKHTKLKKKQSDTANLRQRHVVRQVALPYLPMVKKFRKPNSRIPSGSLPKLYHL